MATIPSFEWRGLESEFRKVSAWGPGQIEIGGEPNAVRHRNHDALLLTDSSQFGITPTSTRLGYLAEWRIL